MSKKIFVTLHDNRGPFSKWLRTVLGATILAVGPIGIGVAVGSPAMEWMGFLIGCLAFVGYAMKQSNDFTSIEDAIAFLSKLNEPGK